MSKRVFVGKDFCLMDHITGGNALKYRIKNHMVQIDLVVDDKFPSREKRKKLLSVLII